MMLITKNLIKWKRVDQISWKFWYWFILKFSLELAYIRIYINVLQMIALSKLALKPSPHTVRYPVPAQIREHILVSAKVWRHALRVPPLNPPLYIHTHKDNVPVGSHWCHYVHHQFEIKHTIEWPHLDILRSRWINIRKLLIFLWK